MSTEHSYHNTTQSDGEELEAYEESAQEQEYRILTFFQQGGKHTPSYVSEMIMPEAPITSCRRGITNLTKRGLLQKTDEQRIGPWGRPEYLWKVQ